jgi:hypothetical protein
VPWQSSNIVKTGLTQSAPERSAQATSVSLSSINKPLPQRFEEIKELTWLPTALLLEVESRYFIDRNCISLFEEGDATPACQTRERRQVHRGSALARPSRLLHHSHHRSERLAEVSRGKKEL